MADVVDNPLLSEQWIAKTDFAIGYTPGMVPAELRFQLLSDRLFTLQFFPSGAIARGEIKLAEAGFSLDAGEGWYNQDGKFLGDEPNFPVWE